MNELKDLIFSTEVAGAIIAILTFLVGRAIWLFEKKTGIQIDQIWRDKLHSALKSHVEAIFEELRIKNGGVPPTQDQVVGALDMKLFGRIKESNPDTVKHFKNITSQLLVKLALQYIPKLI